VLLIKYLTFSISFIDLFGCFCFFMVCNFKIWID
jgi:hypothetical protein